MNHFRVGAATFELEVQAGQLRSLGGIRVHDTVLRNPANRFLPVADSYDGDVFRQFRFEGVAQRGEETVIRATAISDPDQLFQERRDSSGDVCLRPQVWDAPPVEAEFRIVLAPAAETLDGRAFEGFRYHFEYDCPDVAIHRLADRQTWELGGDVEGLTVFCRNLFDLPRQRLGRDVAYSTVGLGKWASLLPGNLWARWSLLPAFDLQHGPDGILAAYFDEVSCIRSVVETLPGEDWLRVVDLHYVAAGHQVRTNPKTVLHCPDVLDDTEAINLWTRLYDRERDKACRQFGIARQSPPQITFSENVWRDFHWDSTYEDVLAAAAELGADCIFIDPCWQNGETFERFLKEQHGGKEGLTQGILGKIQYENMCCTLDFEVSEAAGGEEALRRLCQRAAEHEVRVLSWMSLHYSPWTSLKAQKDLGHGRGGIFAAKESGRHPDTGYAGDCWTVNLNAPVREKIREQLRRTCERTGLGGFLWDSFSNLGWWQVDYSDESLRPQFDHMAALYAELCNAGLYLMPEAIVSFSTGSCCGLHGGNVYADDLLPLSYQTVTSLQYADDGSRDRDQFALILRGERPIDLLFQCFAHQRVPNCAPQRVPREQWDATAVQAIKDLYAVYRAQRHRMLRRTLLPGGQGVLWDDGTASGEQLLWSFQAQPWPTPATDALTGTPATGELAANRVYLV